MFGGSSSYLYIFSGEKIESEETLLLSIVKDMVIKNKTEALDATLALVARGNSVLAEIERLSDNIPPLFRKFSQDQRDSEGGRFWLKQTIKDINLS